MSLPTRSLSRRRLLQSAGAVLGAGALAACTPQSTSDTSSGGGLSISILDDNTNKIFEPLFEQFTQQTGITVERYQQLNFNDLHDRLATTFAAQDRTFDVVMTYAAWSAEFGAAGWLEPLQQSDVPEDVNPRALDCVTWDGTLYGLPKFISVQTMFYNKRMFEAGGLDPKAPPATWDEFVAATRALTGGGRFGLATDMGNVDGAFQNFLRTLLLNGGAMYENRTVPVFDSPAGVDALTRLKALRDEGLMAPTSLQITHSDDLSTFFTSEQAAIVFNWPFQYARATAAESQLDATVLGNAIIPGIAVPSASIDGSEGFAINKFSQNKEAAKEWLRFVTSADVQRRMVLEEGWLPVSSSLLQDEEVRTAQPVVGTFAQQVEYPVTRAGAPWYNEVVDRLSSNITQAMLGQMSPADALADAATNAKEIIARAGG